MSYILRMYIRCKDIVWELMDRSSYHEESPFLVIDLPSIEVAKMVGNGFRGIGNRLLHEQC